MLQDPLLQEMLPASTSDWSHLPELQERDDFCAVRRFMTFLYSAMFRFRTSTGRSCAEIYCAVRDESRPAQSATQVAEQNTSQLGGWPGPPNLGGHSPPLSVEVVRGNWVGFSLLEPG